MHVGNSNHCSNYSKGSYAPAGSILTEVEQEKDIGVTIHKSLKPSAQCAKAAKKSNQVLGQMFKSFHYHDKYVWIRLYTKFVRPHLEFSVQAWFPWYQSDIQMLEKVGEGNQYDGWPEIEIRLRMT